MKKEITTGSIENNYKINFWFMNKMTLLDEKVLHACKSFSLSKLYDEEELKVEDVLKGKIRLVDFVKLFSLKGKVNNSIKNSINNLSQQEVIIKYSETDKVNISLFKEIKYVSENNKAYIVYEFSLSYLKFIWGKVPKNFHVTSAVELKRLTSHYSPKLLRVLKSNISLGVQDLIILIEYKYLRKLLLGARASNESFKKKHIFNRDVIKKAINDINGYTPPEDKRRENRNTFISVKLSYQEWDDKINDFIYHFKTTSSELTLNKIDPNVRLKGVLTSEALKEFSDEKIYSIDSKEKRQTITYEENNFKSNSKIDEKSKDKLMEDKPIF